MRHDKLNDLFYFLPKSKIKAGDGLKEGKYPFYSSSENQSKYFYEYLYEPGNEPCHCGSGLKYKKCHGC